MTKELEPCPFCGKIPQANEVFRDRGVWKADVCCWGCGFAIAYFAASRQEAERMAAHKWNTRYKRTCKMQDALNVPDSDPFDDATDLDGRLENLIRHVADICGAEVIDE